MNNMGRNDASTYRHNLIVRHAIRSLSVRAVRWLGTTSNTTLSSHPLCGQVNGGELTLGVCLIRADCCVTKAAVVDKRIWVCRTLGPRVVGERRGRREQASTTRS
jgi:hypothetical protein